MTLLNTTIDDNSPLIAYAPLEAWIQGNKETDPNSDYWAGTKTWTNSFAATATFSFYGTAITILGAKRINHGTYNVSLDGILYPPFDGNANPPIFQFPIFNATNLTEEHHTVVVTNTGQSGMYLDIDCVYWLSSDSSEAADGSSSPEVIFQDTDPTFTYGPDGAWNTSPQHLDEFSGATGHSTSQMGAMVNYTFNGSAVSLFGTIGPSNSPYSVYLDDTAMGDFNATKDAFVANVMLFHAANLTTDAHRLTLINKQAGMNLQIDYAAVFGSISTSPNVSSPSFPTPTPTTTGLKKHTVLTAGLLAGIIILIVVLVFLLFLAWCLNRRNKTLWKRLQSGYMIQSQFSPLPTTHSLPTSGMSSGRGKSLHYATETQSSSNSSAPLLRPSNSSSGLEDMDFYDPLPPRTPMRADTDTTLVAENGSVDSGPTPLRQLTLKLLPRWGFRGRLRDTPPTTAVERSQSMKRLLLVEEQTDDPLRSSSPVEEEHLLPAQEVSPPAYVPRTHPKGPRYR